MAVTSNDIMIFVPCKRIAKVSCTEVHFCNSLHSAHSHLLWSQLSFSILYKEFNSILFMLSFRSAQVSLGVTYQWQSSKIILPIAHLFMYFNMCKLMEVEDA